MEHSILAASFSAISIALLHWFPWRQALHRPLPNLAAYVLGVLAIALPATWAMSNGADPIRALWGCILAAGGAAVLCYGVDWLIHINHKVADLTEKIDGME